MYLKVICVSCLIFLISAIYGCNSDGKSETFNSKMFNDYWYQGKAEITSYDLEQARYGEIREGYSVLIFVTEDFSLKKQVKLDDPLGAGDDAVKVLKLNLIKKFNTGIYRYSLMESVFTPVDLMKHPNTLKLSTSSQEWCGNVFMQLNLHGNKYDVKLFSYFESEGDREYTVSKAFLEDEIWTRIRVSPSDLPVGKIKMIPGTLPSRLLHNELRVRQALTSLNAIGGEGGLMSYRVKYQDLGRELVINFKSDFPYEIESWEETYTSGWGKYARKLTTRAKRRKTIITDYWKKNKNLDVTLRKELGLDN